jgi:hypothetical protein
LIGGCRQLNLFVAGRARDQHALRVGAPQSSFPQ